MSNRGEKTVWDAETKRHNSPLSETGDDLKKLIKKGDWNDVVLVAKGNHVTYTINGHLMTDLTDESPKALKEGVMAFQLHAGFVMDIQFKDIEIKDLSGSAGSKSARCTIRASPEGRPTTVNDFACTLSAALPGLLHAASRFENQRLRRLRMHPRLAIRPRRSRFASSSPTTCCLVGVPGERSAEFHATCWPGCNWPWKCGPARCRPPACRASRSPARNPACAARMAGATWFSRSFSVLSSGYLSSS